jgi:hypothetical protein
VHNDNGTNWNLFQRLEDSNSSHDGYGYSVAVGDTMIAVGAPTAYDNSGLVYLYERDVNEPVATAQWNLTMVFTVPGTLML